MRNLLLYIGLVLTWNPHSSLWAAGEPIPPSPPIDGSSGHHYGKSKRDQLPQQQQSRPQQSQQGQKFQLPAGVIKPPAAEIETPTPERGSDSVEISKTTRFLSDLSPAIRRKLDELGFGDFRAQSILFESAANSNPMEFNRMILSAQTAEDLTQKLRGNPLRSLLKICKQKPR